MRIIVIRTINYYIGFATKKSDVHKVIWGFRSVAIELRFICSVMQHRIYI